MLIINADDWGRSVAETDAALRCFKQQRITTVSAMVYMEDSERGAALAAEHELSVGLHLNFSQQFGASNCGAKLRDCHNRIVRFLKGNKYAQLLYNPFLANAFSYSFRAQWDEFVRLYGKIPAHVDGHHHMHLCANMLLSKLIPAGIRVRRNFSFWPGEKSWLNRFYRQAVDRRLARRYKITDYFFDLTTSLEQGNLDRVARLAQSSTVELMTHPVSSREQDFLLSDQFGEMLHKANQHECVIA